MKPSARVISWGRLSGLALLALIVSTGGAAAQSVPTGTGCLKLATGTISKIKVGLLPLVPCGPGEVLARLSSGDITAVATPAAGGLQGGTSSGDANLSLQPGFRLPQACATGQVPLWNGSAWECSTPSTGGGSALAKLEDLVGLPCGAGSEAGTVALAINPVSHTVGIACPRLGQFMLDVAVGGPGSVASVTPEITCGLGGGDCAHSFDPGTVVDLAASNDAGTTAFLGWGGACGGADPTCQVTMNQARQVTAVFLPTLSLHVITTATARETHCAFNICVTADQYSQSRARVTVVDLNTALVAGVCDADTTVVIPVVGFGFPTSNTTTCNVAVVPGHHLRLLAEDSAVLGGVETFLAYAAGACDGSTNPICEPPDAVTVHAESTVAFH
jgi:hypothetical protein